MARGPKKHLKRVRAPSSWMLSKLGGIFAVRPSQGPHKLRESIPLYVVLKHRLRYALVGREVKQILNDREGLIKIDGKVRRDHGFPIGVMDTISIEKTNEHFRVIYDEKGRFKLIKIKAEDANTKLLKVKHKAIGPNKIPYIVTHDSRTIRFPTPGISVNDTIKYNFKEKKIEDIIKFELGNTCLATFGKNIGRVGVITHREKHLGGFDIVHLRDTLGHTFATRINNVFLIGRKGKSLLSLHKHEGLRLNALMERDHDRKELLEIKQKKDAQHAHHHHVEQKPVSTSQQKKEDPKAKVQKPVQQTTQPAQQQQKTKKK